MEIDISINGVICIQKRLPNGDIFKRKYQFYSKTEALREFKAEYSEAYKK
jgi:hypothetical protein